MRTKTQHKPLGTDSATDFQLSQQSRAHDEVQFFDSQEIYFRQTTRGLRAYLKKKIYPIQAGGPSQFVLVSDGGDYYNCYTWINGQAGTAIVKVAKHQDICCILPTATPAGLAWPSKVIRGVTYTYVYNPVGGVTADMVGIIEYTRGVTGSDMTATTQKITPCLNIGDIITADPFNFTTPATLNQVTWIARADGRAWAGPNPAS